MVAMAAMMAMSHVPRACASTPLRTSVLITVPGSRLNAAPFGSRSSSARRSCRVTPFSSRTEMSVAARPMFSFRSPGGNKATA